MKFIIVITVFKFVLRYFSFINSNAFEFTSNLRRGHDDFECDRSILFQYKTTSNYEL